MSEKENEPEKQDMGKLLSEIINGLISGGAKVEKAIVYDAKTGESKELDISQLAVPAIEWKDTAGNILALGDTVTWRSALNSIGRIVGLSDSARRLVISWEDKNGDLSFISPENAFINVTLIDRNDSDNPPDIGSKGISKYLATKVTLDPPKDGDDACDCDNCVAARYMDKYSKMSGLTDMAIYKEIATSWDDVFNSQKKPSAETAKAIEEADTIIAETSKTLLDPAVIEEFQYIATDGYHGLKGFHDLERAKKWAAGMEIEYDRPFNIYTKVQG